MSPNSHDLWRSIISTNLINAVKWQWAMLVLGWVASVHKAIMYNLDRKIIDILQS